MGCSDLCEVHTHNPPVLFHQGHPPTHPWCLAHTFSLTYTHSLGFSVTHTFFGSFYLSINYFLTHISPSSSLTYTQSHNLSLSLALSHTPHTHTRIHTWPTWCKPTPGHTRPTWCNPTPGHTWSVVLSSGRQKPGGALSTSLLLCCLICCFWSSKFTSCTVGCHPKRCNCI